MTLRETLLSVWQQVLVDGKLEVGVDGVCYPVIVFRAKGLRSVEFQFVNLRIVGVEQNPAASSHWAELARQGNRIMQFRCKGSYVANVCEEKLVRYPKWKSLGLPE